MMVAAKCVDAGEWAEWKFLQESQYLATANQSLAPTASALNNISLSVKKNQPTMQQKPAQHNPIRHHALYYEAKYTVPG